MNTFFVFQLVCLIVFVFAPLIHINARLAKLERLATESKDAHAQLEKRLKVTSQAVILVLKKTHPEEVDRVRRELTEIVSEKKVTVGHKGH